MMGKKRERERAHIVQKYCPTVPSRYLPMFLHKITVPKESQVVPRACLPRVLSSQTRPMRWESRIYRVIMTASIPSSRAHLR